MRFLVIAFAAVIVVVGASTLSANYLPPIVDNSLPVHEYLAPSVEATENQTVLADDGYRYKTVRRLKFRQRRDVNKQPANEYLPTAPNAEESLITAAVEPVPEVKTQLADNGYRYKVVRRLKYRQRRDVNELPKNEYLPPTKANDNTAVVEVAQPLPEEKTQLDTDGYRYKVVRRLKYRHRRNVNELPQNEYLAPVESKATPQSEYLPPVETTQEVAIAKSTESVPEQDTQLANDGYRYKVVRRLKYRHRRDVNELPQKEYLAPAESKATPQSEYLPPVETAQEVAIAKSTESVPEQDTQLANDGYRYKVVRRLKYRHRRDVNELPQKEYLAPAESKATPQSEYLPPVETAQEVAIAKSTESVPEQDTQLANDGYRYKVVRRLIYRQRRDVNELPQKEYLAPAASKATPQSEYLPPVETAQEIAIAKSTESVPEQDTQLANDGYRYKIVRRLKYRHRRDVNELPQNEYLPPAEDFQEHSVASEVAEPVTEDAATILANDGYRYKVVRRLKYRQRRDVSELPANEYLPPAVVEGQEVVEQLPEVEAAVLTKDGYRYKTVRRLKYRRH